MRIYLAGPMSGLPHFNFPAFHEATKKLRDEGHIVFNPAERDIERDGVDWGQEIPDGDKVKAAARGFDLRVALGEDLAFICAEAEAIAMLPGWEDSKGARAEWAVAHALGLVVIPLS